MKPRPLIKWKSFWLGILVLGFLGWAWTGSTSHFQEAMVKWGPASGLCVGHGGGSVEILWNTNYFPPVSGSLGAFSSYGAYRWIGRLSFEVDAGMEMPYWLLILLFLVPWVGFLAWRWRKVRRTANAV